MCDERIERFTKMTEADPDNELGHFSLGKAYLDARRYEEAASSFRHVLDLSQEFSKTYALLGQCLIALGRRDEAVETLRKGYRLAHERGDMMPRNEMGVLLRELGEAPPMVEETAPARTAAPATEGFACKRCGGGGRLPTPPMSGELGQRVHESICADCWKEWIGMGTMIINELRLDLRSEEAQRVYDDHMKEFLRLES
ncbi:MAG: Fe(2+)-trafficking protein [Phycisphaerales bacterium]|nr:MAG: Fe(2+)-trafficking protein [Phycisphaerales bacterium]